MSRRDEAFDLLRRQVRSGDRLSESGSEQSREAGLDDGVVARDGNDATERARDEQVDGSEGEELRRRGELRADGHERERAREADAAHAGERPDRDAAARLHGGHADARDEETSEAQSEGD